MVALSVIKPTTKLISRALSQAQTLPSSWYFDLAIAFKEPHAIFHHTWQLVAKGTDLPNPGSFFTTELVGEPILLTRDDAGTVRAFYNVCRHRAGPVAVGCGSRRALSCAYHGWTYGLDGHLISAREMEGVEEFDYHDYGLQPISVAEWGPLIFVNCDSSAPSFEEDYGAIIAEVKTLGFDLNGMCSVERRDYDIRCNWKVYVDNYLEGYHIPIVHPGLFQELDYDQYQVITYRNYSKQCAPVRPHQGEDERRYGRYLQDDPSAAPEALYYWIFPNLMLNIYPDNISTNVILPKSVDQTLTIFEWYKSPIASPEEMKATIDFSEEIQQEDIRICELVQKGLKSQSYDRGRYSVLRENGVHHFHQLVVEAIAD